MFIRSFDKRILTKSIADLKIRDTIPNHSSPPFFSTAKIARDEGFGHWKTLTGK